MGSLFISLGTIAHKHAMADYDLKLIYFNIAGKAEAIRLALKYVGIEFEDYKLKDGEFAKMKESGELKFGQVPALKVTNKSNGEVATLTQSGAILRFIAKLDKKSILLPNDPIKAAVVDAFLDQEADAFQSVRCITYADRFGLASVSKEQRLELKEEINKDYREYSEILNWCIKFIRSYF